MNIKSFLKILKENVKLRTLILLVIFLSFNSFAWFIYATKVSGGVSAHISSWNIEFKLGQDQIVTNMDFDVDRIYPGMETYTKEITVRNTGEIIATINYKINKIEILDQSYEINETTTSEDLLNILQNQFPFKINLNVTNNSLLEGNSSSTFTISLEWPFESGDDAFDTLWGEKAYEYYSTNPENKSVHIEIEIEAIQT